MGIALSLLLVVAIAFLLYVAMQPAAFTVRREGFIAAPPQAVFAQVNDFHNWQAWSPWAQLDPNAKATFEGPSSGLGSAFSWAGNRNVGAGKMTILESVPGELVRMRLDFLQPMQATNEALFTFEPVQGGTHMSWSMSGRNNFISRTVCAFMNMDKMVGGMFEKGIANIRQQVESAR